MRKLGEVQSQLLLKARMPRYYEAVKHLNEKQFGRLVNHFLDCMEKWPPTPDEFRSKAIDIRNSDESKVWKEEERGVQTPGYLDELLKRYGVKSLPEAIAKRKLEEGEGL